MKGGKSKADTSKKADTRLSTKRRATEKVKKTAKKAKGGKDPNKPKRPPSAFFVFMEDFRKQFKEKNPNNKLVSVVGKAGGDRWKSMSDADKAPFVAKASKYKTEYTKNMAAYNKKQSEGPNKNADEEEEESDKSKSEVNDDDEEEEGSEGEEEEDEE